jgi:hypothetical protein
MMKTVHADPTFMMQALQLLRLRGVGGCRIVCSSGLLLVTATGEARDVELSALDDYVIPNNGLVLMEAVRASIVRVERPARGAWRNAINRPFWRSVFGSAQATGARPWKSGLS